ncbi:MAG: STAS/SEC14 domain-containing protein [Chitinophagaceae bacterium]|nr:STAS/SEC14 domain-containing protein [Chitinophagaceae bacterium]
MITAIHNIPQNMVAFRATGTVSSEDFERIVMPAVNKLVELTGELNYLMIIDTDLKNFTLGAWWQDALLGIKKIMKWRRAAIVSNSEGIRKFTDIFSVVMPGEFRGFDSNELENAITWVSEKSRAKV